MDTRRMISAMLLAIAVFYAWVVISRAIWPEPAVQQPASRPAETAQAPTSRPATTTASVPAERETTITMPPASGTTLVSGGENESPVILGSAVEGSPFPMEIKADPVGARVSTVLLSRYHETVARKNPYTIIAPVDVTDKAGLTQVEQSFGTEIQIVKPSLQVPLDKAVWKIDTSNDQQVVFSADVRSPEGQPLIRVFKTYTLRPQKPESHTSNADLSLKTENVSGRPLEMIVSQQGPIGFRKEDPRSEDRRVVGAVWHEGSVATKFYQRSQVLKHKQVTLGSDSKEGGRIAWVAEGNKYFDCIMAPAGRNSGNVPAVFSRAETVIFDPGVEANADVPRQDLTFRYISDPIKLSAGASHDVGFDLYIGPKSKKAFESVPTYVERSYYKVLTGEYAFCTPGWLVGLMMWLLNAVHSVWPHNYGIAIIVLVLLVKSVLHPLSVKSQVNMQKMQKNQARLKPRMDAIKEKYANDRAKMNQAIGEMMKEEGINPAGQLLNCLPMMIQIPIWVALWTALSYNVEMRHAPFDGYWITDLTRPDEAFKLFSHPVHIPIIGWLMGGSLQYLNLLPILLGVFQVLQTRFMPRSNVSPQSNPSGAPDQLEQQRKMMMLMSVVFTFVLYNAPSGLTLYIMVNNLLSILEQWKVRQHLRELEARGEDADSEPGVFKRISQRAFKGREGRKSWLHRKWEELQKEIADAKRVQSQRNKGKGKR